MKKLALSSLVHPVLSTTNTDIAVADIVNILVDIHNQLYGPGDVTLDYDNNPEVLYKSGQGHIITFGIFSHKFYFLND